MDVFSNVLEMRNLSLFNKIIEHRYFVQNFTPVVGMILKIQSSPFLEGYGHFTNVNSQKRDHFEKKNYKKIPFML